MSISKQSRVLVYVQHLLGVGHVQRALHLARALALQHFSVELVTGGMPHAMTDTADFPVHQLSPLYSPDGSFTRLLDADGKAIDDRWRERRKRQLLAVFDAFEPQVLITETFPFGRRMLRFELLPLLQRMRAGSGRRLVIASIRDILQPRSKPGRNIETCEWLEAYYDRVLVHGDDSIARLDDSFDCARRIREMTYYSGYLCAGESQLPPADEGRDEVLVSAGGSATGLQILRTALAAKSLSAFADLHWRVLASPAIAATDFAELQRLAGTGVTVERNRTDFSELVKRARLSISQAGYNTMTDIMNSDTACVVIPFAEADEVEQSLRAQALQRRGRLVALAQQDLTAAALARAMTLADAHNQPLAVNLNGAANSVALIRQWLDEMEPAA